MLKYACSLKKIIKNKILKNCTSKLKAKKN